MLKLHRSELTTLSKWLNKPNRKPLIIRGAGQVGKSTLVRQLAEKNNRFCLELNFEKNPELSDFFNSKNPQQILQRLAIYPPEELSF